MENSSLEEPYPEPFFSLDEIGIAAFIAYAIAILLLLLLSGIISGSEVAFFSLSKSDIDLCQDSNKKSDLRVWDLIKNPQRLLATILISNNLVNISIVTLSTFVTWQLIGSSSMTGLVVAGLTVIITVMIVYFGEIIPKFYANEDSVNFARKSSSVLVFFDYLFRPVTWILLSVGTVMEKRVEKKGYNLSVDELNAALEITTEKESTEEEKEILKGIVNFGTLSVTQVMKSRMDITAIDTETDFHELMNQINKTGYSRIPIYRDTIDHIEGILYIKDLLTHLDEKDDFQWQSLLRKAYIIPESKKIDALFKDFQEKRVHMAIIVDEYGGTSGLITMEDVIEEIIGEINDEFDEEVDLAYNKLDSSTYIFEGKTTLNDFCKITDVESTIFDEVKGESESVGGLLLELNHNMPNAGEKITYKHFDFTAVAVNKKRIKKVRVLINPIPDESDD